MCNLLEYIAESRGERNGFKVAMKRGGKYYSPAMGTQYHSGEFVTIPKKQKKLTSKFNSSVLTSGTFGYRDNMIGRSAIFTDLLDAKYNAQLIHDQKIRGYKTVVLEATVSVDVMSGHYSVDEPVYAGKRLTLGKEIPVKLYYGIRYNTFPNIRFIRDKT